MKIIVKEEGLEGPSGWGTPVFIGWDLMESVKPFSFLPWLKFLRITVKGQKSVLWLPLFLENENAFKDSIRKNAPENNVLRLNIE